MEQITATWRKQTITDQERTGLTVTINLALDEHCSVDGLMTAKRDGLIGFVVNGTMIPCNLHQISWQDAKIATIYAQKAEFEKAGVSTDVVPTASLKLAYSVDEGLFAGLENPWVKSKKPSKDQQQQAAADDGDEGDEDEGEEESDAGEEALQLEEKDEETAAPKRGRGRPRKFPESGASARA